MTEHTTEPVQPGQMQVPVEKVIARFQSKLGENQSTIVMLEMELEMLREQNEAERAAFQEQVEAYQLALVAAGVPDPTIALPQPVADSPVAAVPPLVRRPAPGRPARASRKR